MLKEETRFAISPEEPLELRIANLTMIFRTQTIRREVRFTPSHLDFIINQKAGIHHDPAFLHKLSLDLHQDAKFFDSNRSTPLCCNKIWELWQDHEGKYVFHNPMQTPVRMVTVEPGFDKGTIQGDFTDGPSSAVEILPQSLEIVLFTNWLADIGDIMLHASGLVINGKAFAFLGESGAGKSTLVRSLLGKPDVSILGEDQVILRFIQDRLWMYGTPWHMDQALCSPDGAPVEALFILDRDAPHGVHPIPSARAYERILQTAFIPYYRRDVLVKLMDQIHTLVNSVRIKSLSHRLGEDVLKTIQPA